MSDDTPPQIMETDRLLLRPFTIDDAQAVFSYASDPDVTRFMDWPTHQSIDTSIEWIQLTLNRWERHEEFTWGITVKTRDIGVIGAISCREIDFKVSFGYVLDKAHWGMGFATEASRALVDMLSSINGVRRIWATCDIDNQASANVLAKSGCSLEGNLRNWAIRPNLPGAPPRDSLVYAKIVNS